MRLFTFHPLMRRFQEAAIEDSFDVTLCDSVTSKKTHAIPFGSLEDIPEEIFYSEILLFYVKLLKMAGIALDEYELLGDARYRSYISSIDKALKNFEYTSEWADLISALGKLNKVLLSNVKYSIIPRRITISKRLAQCMHPALPSGVHLKALETYDIIFKCIGPTRLSQELFIYSAGLFPLLGNAAMNVRPSLLTIYETHFVPLGVKLRPGLNGFLIGVLPGLEEGSEYYERTDQLLQAVCNNVERSFFYGCMWKCILSNPTIRLPAVSFIITHYNRKLCMEDQLFIIGTDIDTMVQGLCASLQDNSVLVQRCALDLLLLGFPVHSNQLLSSDMVQVVTSALTVVLRRDMSLNRRLFSWLMGGDALGIDEMKKSAFDKVSENSDANSYFRDFAKGYLLKALQKCLDDPQTVMPTSSVPSNAELWCYRLLISLLDRPEISSVILDDVLIDIFRSLYLACHSTYASSLRLDRRNKKTIKDKNELKKAANLLFGTLEPSYLWEYSAKHFEIACQIPSSKTSDDDEEDKVLEVGSGKPNLTELCSLVNFLLDVVSLETYLEAKTEHLPKLLCDIFGVLSRHCAILSIHDISVTLKLCSKLLCKMQPPLINVETEEDFENSVKFYSTESINCKENSSKEEGIFVEKSSCPNVNFSYSSSLDFNLDRIDIEKNKVKSSFSNIRSIITLCTEKYQEFFVIFLKEKVIKDVYKFIERYQSLLLGKQEREFQREKNLEKLLQKCLSIKCNSLSSEEVKIFKQNITDSAIKKIDPPLNDFEHVSTNPYLCQTFEHLCNLLFELSSFPTFYTNSKSLYNKHLNAARSSEIPEWLKLIIALSCFVTTEEIFFSATSTFFDLISLTKSVLYNNEINEVASEFSSSSDVRSQASCSDVRSQTSSDVRSQNNSSDVRSPSSSDVRSQASSSTVVLVALTPVVSASQLEFLSNETLIFNVAANKLWNYIGDDRPNFCFRGTELLQQVHNLSPANSICETVICNSMSSGDEMQQVEAQKKFSILWHLTRDLNLKSTPSAMIRVFDRCLFLMLDNLGKETGPQKAISQAWLNHSLQRGDVARFLEPILLILLHPDSARVSVQHVSVHSKRVVSVDKDLSNPEDTEAKVYAISSTSGHVIYHISDDSHPSSHQPSPERKILALTSVLNVDSNKGSTVVTHNSMIQDFELPSSHERDLKLPISVFVNPFGSLSSLGSDSQLDYVNFASPDLSQAKRIDFMRRSSFEEDIIENEPISDSEMSIENVVSSVLNEIIAEVVLNELSEKETQFSTDFNFIDDFNESCDLCNSSKKLSDLNSMSQLTVHPLHTYILLYCQVYDSKKTLYALYSLKAIILTNPRIALCSMSTTNISNSLSLRGQKLQILLARHRKSVFGNNFHGELTAEATTMFRSNTYVEVIVAACLYHIRSHYPNLPHVKLTEEEVIGNRNVRLLCMEVLTLVFSELVGIVKDSGKSFASYLSDLLHRSKVQKTLLHCLAASVYDSQHQVATESEKNTTFTEAIVEFNEKPYRSGAVNKFHANDFQDTFQVHLLRLMATLIVLEDTILSQNGSEKDVINNVGSKTADNTSEKKSSKLPSPNSSSKFQPGVPIPCQSMFLSTILTALRQEHNVHLHIHWLSLVTSALSFVGRWLPRLVMTVVNQLCINLENVIKLFGISSESSAFCSLPPKSVNMPPDYLITLIEGLTTLCHYCLLECPSPVLSPLNQPPLPPVPSQPYAPGTTASQIISNLIHVFSTSSNQKDLSGRDSSTSFDPILAARRVLLSNLPRVISSITSVFRIVTEVDKQNHHREWWIMGTPKIVKQHILSFLSPISLNHGSNFMAAIAVVWHENRNTMIPQIRKVIPTWSKEQLLLVELVAAIKVFPLESIIQTIRNVIKQPPSMSQKNKVAIEVNTLQFFLAYIQQTSGSQLIETWQALLGLWKDGLQITYPLVQFHLLGILHEFVLRSPLLEDKKSQKDLQDIAHKLIEACSTVACDSLEQTTWLWRNLAVRPGPQSDISSRDDEVDSIISGDISDGSISSLSAHNNAQYSVQALCCLAEFLAPVLDFVYVGEEKEKVIPLLSNIMHYATPYLKNHSAHNIPSFRACCQLLANISGYQHTRKAWKKEAFELLLDTSFFQMSSTCIGYWRSIIDHLMTHDKTTFRDFMSRVSVTQPGSLNIFSTKEQEYEQRAQLLKRLAFVIFCSEIDQYQKYMPDIQERLTESLRMSHIPIVQAHIFLCFRVLLVRMTSHHVTSLWPVIITEMVQVFTQIEYDLCTDSEEFSSHLRRISTLDSSWVMNSGNGLNAHNHPAWLHLYLSVCKLLDMTVALPANVLPQFQMYRWAFIGDSPPLSSEYSDRGENKYPDSPEFVPHIKRLANLLNKKLPSDERLPFNPGQLLLSMPNISSIVQLQPFFNTLSNITNQGTKVSQVSKSEIIVSKEENRASPIWKSRSAPDILMHTSTSEMPVINSDSTRSTAEQIESILEVDFLELCT
ncbi:protein dopey-1 [Caerostris darwini]|uniref:Protein dopey-1 n=1 Tax=Caerostris darwini TaxID=1538125 RepID=A0AAV4T1B3_9ARAC|nr:protein dopey-1 [Caerostris darwini]